MESLPGRTVVDAEIPFPPSVNRLWGFSADGKKRYLLPRQRDYREFVAFAVPKRNTKPDDEYFIDIEFSPPDRRKRDIDNLIKPVLDALEAAGAIHDDSQVSTLRVRRVTRYRPSPSGHCRVRVNFVSGPMELLDF